MKTRIYKSYSTNFKTAAIIGEKVNVNYHTKYYWEHKGKAKIEKALLKDGFADIVLERIAVNEKINKVLKNVFDFFMKLLERKNSLRKLYRKQRADILLLIEQIKSFADVMSICKLFRITERTYFNWKNKPVCKTTFTRECPNISAGQITDEERRILENEYFLNELYVDFSLADLYAQMLRDKKVLVSESLFYGLAAFLGEVERRKVVRRKKYRTGLRAEKPKEILHMDKTLYTTEDGKRPWIYLICDNRSRAILNYKISLESKSAISVSNIKSAIEKHNLMENSFWLVSDDGSENKGEVKKFAEDHPQIKLKIAQQDIPHSNSMVEAVIKLLKYRYLKNQAFLNMHELEKALAKAVYDYNNRPRRIHFGKTPLEVLSGNFPDLDEIRELKLKARQNRLEANRNFNCLKAFYSSTEKTQGKKAFFH